MRRALAAVLVLGAISGGTTVQAQQGGRGRVTLGGGVRWMGTMPVAEVAATETTAGGGSRTIFNSETRLNSSLGATVSVGVRLTPTFTVEGGTSFNPTRLTTRVSDDIEQAGDTSASEHVDQLLAEGGVLVTPFARAASSRLRPFLIAGLGYVRYLNEGRTLVETGSEFYAGAGVYYERRSAGAGRVRSTGLRLDARMAVLRGGIAVGTGGHPAPAITAAVFARF